MAKQTIELDIPDGYEFDRITMGEWIDHYPNEIGNRPIVILRKKQPKRHVFEESVTKRKVTFGDVYMDSLGRIYTWSACCNSDKEFIVLTEVKE